MNERDVQYHLNFRQNQYQSEAEQMRASQNARPIKSRKRKPVSLKTLIIILFR